MLKSDITVLFQGDSITDRGRDRENYYGLGTGYPNYIAALIGAKYPEKNITFVNRGISGNRVKDLKARWQTDCIDIKPDILSILIGINDVWRRYDRNDETSMESYEDDYRYIIEEALKNGIEKIVLLSPFVLPCPEDRKTWREDLDPKIQVVRSLAREYKLDFIDLDGFFAEKITKIRPEFYAPDGVHPSDAGHAAIALKWIEFICDERLW